MNWPKYAYYVDYADYADFSEYTKYAKYAENAEKVKYAEYEENILICRLWRRLYPVNSFHALLSAEKEI